jgi:hypothetical protein
MTTPFSLRIFVADGDPDGLRIVERSNWIGRALVFPRALLPQVKQRPELAQTGVYLLLGPRPDGEGEMLYVGEGDPIRPRLESHYGQKDFWTRAIGFTTAGQLNKAHVQFLEARLIALAKAAKRVPLDNVNQPAEPSLSEADRADMEVFLAHMLGMLPVLGVHAFEQAPAPTAKVVRPLDVPDTGGLVVYAAGVSMTCKAKGVEATGFESSQGFVVQKGSQAVRSVTPSFVTFPGSLKRRDELIANGVLAAAGDVHTFTQDFVFTSPSAASDLVLGSVTNGRTAWKDAQGRTLKELQQAEAKQP